VRLVQNLRKKAALDQHDRIALSLTTNGDLLGQAIDTHRASIWEETQADPAAAPPANGESHREEVKVEGQPLTITLARL
jgi:hypothetical protein